METIGQPAPVVVDTAQIRTAFQQIITNTREAMPWGGHLRVTLQTEAIAQENGNLFKPGRYIRIDFRDDGCGISSDHIDKIFDPYFTTKRMGTEKGMGLGLAVSHSIITKHREYITVRSEQGRGTCVTIHLPEASPPDAAKTTRSPTKDAPQTGIHMHAWHHPF